MRVIRWNERIQWRVLFGSMNTVEVVPESCRDRADLGTEMVVEMDTQAEVECSLIRRHLRLVEGDEDKEAPRLTR